MRTHPLTIAAAAAGCAALLLVGGCGADQDPEDTAAVSEADEGPLSVYWEQAVGDMEGQDWSDMGRRSEEIVAACMVEQGFEYKQQDMSDLTETIEQSEEDAEAFGTEEYAAEHGYGMSTSFDPAGEGEAGPDEWVDPNADYVAGMSETEQAAYYAALFGEQTPDPETGEMPEGDWTTQGCQGKAQHEVYEQGQAWNDDEFADLQQGMTDLYERAQEDPKVVEANTEWATCMADAGLGDHTSPDAAMTTMSDEFSALLSTVTEESPEPDPAALAEFKEKEIATAVADARCKKSTDYDATLRRVQFALEQEFVDQNKAELEAWVEKYSTADAD